MFSAGGGGGYVAEKAETLGRLAVPGRRRGRPSSAMSTCSATCSGAIEEGREPRETFYDGYVVNAVMDAAYRSAKSRAWEPVELADWRGGTTPRIARRPRPSRARPSSSARSCPTAGRS